jgi:hypothetical protein
MTLETLEGEGWTMVEPPEPNDEGSVVARYDGEPVRAGFMVDTVEDSEDTMHRAYRSGRYDLEVKIDFEIGRGQVKVTRAEGYD